MINYRSAKVTATGNVSTGPARLIAIHAVCAGSAGSIVLKDSSTGATLLDLDTPGSATAVIETYIGELREEIKKGKSIDALREEIKAIKDQ